MGVGKYIHILQPERLLAYGLLFACCLIGRGLSSFSVRSCDPQRSRHRANHIEPDPNEPRYIFTEVGVGYRMADSEDTNRKTNQSDSGLQA